MISPSDDARPTTAPSTTSAPICRSSHAAQTKTTLAVDASAMQVAQCRRHWSADRSAPVALNSASPAIGPSGKASPSKQAASRAAQTGGPPASFQHCQAGLRELGWVEGRNLRIEYRWAPDPDLLHRQAAELVAATPDLILANTTPVLAALLRESTTLPIVFAQVTDPNPFERSHRFPVIPPNSGRRDYSRSSCDGGRRSSGLVPGSRQDACAGRNCRDFLPMPR